MVSIAQLLLESFILEYIFGLLWLIVCEFFVFFLQPFILIVKLMQLRYMGLLSHASLSLDHFILLEVTKVLKRLGDLLIREFVFELVRIKVELSDHLIDLFNVGLQALLGVLNSLIPEHGVISLDILLCHQYITAHLKISSPCLSC